MLRNIFLRSALFISLGTCLIACKEHSDYKVVANRAGIEISKVNEAAVYAGGSGKILRGGKLVYEWGDTKKLYPMKSTTKSIGTIALGLALKDGLLDLKDPIAKHYPIFKMQAMANHTKNWLSKITFFHLATHTAGFDKPGGITPLLFEPGTAWAYSDSGPNWIADCLTYLYRQDLQELLFKRVFSHMGIKKSDLIWRDNRYREKFSDGIPRREFGSGVIANVDAMAKIGMLFLRNGDWNGKNLIPKNYVNKLRKPDPYISKLPVKNDKKSVRRNASHHYGLLWWNNGDGTIQRLPSDAFWAHGLYDSFILVIPSLDVVAVRAGKSFEGDRSPDAYRVYEPFFVPLADAVNYGSPYPNSPVISNIIWDDIDDIKRKAKGSDNWPMTWADDNFLYTAYGDGWGFRPKLKKKMSLGFAKITGDPHNFSGKNFRSSGEQFGDGKNGKKASGLLMVKGVLYMWVRNIDGDGKHSQLAWSKDYGKTWKWSQWKFDEFGYCTFINYGKNYKDVRDGYVYIVSHDNPSAYKRADQFILMRVPANSIKDRDAYEFFENLDADNKPLWTADIKKRGAIFFHVKSCHRSGISYNEGLRRYIWWQAKFPEDTDGRYESRSFGIFDAPEPWGPWTTIYYTKNWDVETGETGSFPTKWMNQDGKTMYLVFSGDDAFSVRKATLFLSLNAKIK
jgi:CubicO group peptidase (beta-lactamase class C family)